jgi:hypothetical protein
MSKFSHKLQRKALKLVLFDEFVEIDAEQLKSDAHMTSKHKVVIHVDQVKGIVFILLSQMLKNANLFLGLAVKPLLIPYHLECNMLKKIKSVLIFG